MKNKILILISLMFIVFSNVFSQNNITITDNASHNADASAMLDVYSTSKGMLVPRMNAAQIAMISNPATGLLVFSTTDNAFWFYNGSIWQNLSSTGTDIWGVNGSTGDVYVNDLMTNIGIGTDEPVSKLAVVANAGANPDDPLFEIQDELGNPIFSVTSEGVRVYVKDVETSKGISGGFAVGKYGIAKDIPGESYLVVTPDSTRVYLQEGTKAVSGGFAVGKYGIAKGETNTIFFADADSTRVFTNTSEKGVSGGFAVGKYGIAKGPNENYMHLTRNNYLIGHRAGEWMTTGISNIFLGYESGFHNLTGVRNTFIGHYSGYTNKWGDNNIYIGDSAGYLTEYAHDNIFIGNSAGYNTEADDFLYGSQNVFLGNFSGYHNLEGFYNVYIGQESGYSNLNGDGNVYIGGLAGKASSNSDNNTYIGGASFYKNTTGEDNVSLGAFTGQNNITGSGNVFIGYSAGKDELGSNRLYIENSGSTTPLIYGEFDNNYIGINTSNPTHELHVQGGTNPTISINNLEISYLGAGLMGIDGDIVPYASVSYDLGNNNASEHWDDIVGDDFLNFSDINTKHSIKKLKLGLSEILKLKPVTYIYNKNISIDGRTRIGLIAQEVEEIIPHVVYNDDIDVNPETGEIIVKKGEYKAMNYIQLIPVLINGIKEQQEIINKQELRIKKLEESNKEFKKILNSILNK